MSPSPRTRGSVPVDPPIHITREHGVEATVSLAEPDEVVVAVQVTAGHLPMTARRELVEAIFALPEVRGRHRLRASFPLGDWELLDAFAQHCPRISTRPAGSSCLVDARR